MVLMISRIVAIPDKKRSSQQRLNNVLDGIGFGNATSVEKESGAGRRRNLWIARQPIERGITLEADVAHDTGLFKRCSLCGWEWQTREDFLTDSTLSLNGYQGSIRRLRMGEMGRGLLLFTHRREECGTTLAVEAKRFKEDAGEARG